MKYPIDQLEARVNAAVELIGTLRTEIRTLETALTEKSRRVDALERLPRSEGGDLASENSRLRAERAEVRERLRGLIRDIDRVLG